MSTLRIKDLHVSVETAEGPKEILKGVNLTINSGEIHAIMGPNGSAKSTMAYALAGPDVFGINSGAGLGVALIMLSMGGSLTAPIATPYRSPLLRT